MNIVPVNMNPPALQARRPARRAGHAATATASSLDNGNGGDNSGAMSLDPARPIRPELLIDDLLQTNYCVPGSTMLVEAVDAAIPVAKRYRMVRLLLGDGELCIQALLSADMHSLVDKRRIYPGCYVQLHLFSLRWLTADEDLGAEHPGHRDDDVMTTGRTAENPTVPYLLLEDITPVGWNVTYLKLLGRQRQSPRIPGRPGSLASRVKSPDQPAPDAAAPVGRHNAPTKSVRFLGAEQEEEESSEFTQPTRFRACTQHNPAHHNVSASSGARQGDHTPWICANPSQPVRLTALSSIPSLPYKQNWMVNVLAVVASVGEVEPSYLPPYWQRRARLADPSTEKHVQLTVLLDPEDFLPAVGSVVLLLGVKNHLFEGGSLRKYASDRPRAGSRWWYEDPDDLDWCDVAGLRSWWQQA